MSELPPRGLDALRTSFFASLPRYEDRGSLGKGGMGYVFRALDRELNEEIAIKVLSRSRPDEREAVLLRFKREVSVNRKISHPNVCRLYDYGVAGESPYLTMEFVEGVDLGTLLDSGGPIPSARALRILTQLTRGVAAAHAAGIVHRDLKPANVMVRPSGDISILDFGLAHDTSRTDPRITGAGTAVGTPQYMSPEQLRGLVVDERSDIYAIGVMAFELLTGRRLFTGRTFLSIAQKHLETLVSRDLLEKRGISRELSAVVLRCLAKKPEERFQTAAAVATSLEALERLQAPRAPAAEAVPPREARVKTAVHRRSSILAAIQETPAAAHEAATSARPLTVLVVDDEEGVRNLICVWLRRAGLEVVSAASGEDALTLFETCAFDLVLIDVLMPGLDGFDTVRVLKSRPEQAALPILFMSGFPEKNRVLFAGQTGAVDFLPKPLDMKALVGKVLAILTKPAA
ncbi:MAG: protein kinase [Acidobacteriota bacterium]|nr:protein kinase [Acidobacteriota bacterium]